MTWIERLVQERAQALAEMLLAGGAPDYPAYRETQGRYAELTDLLERIAEQRKNAEAKGEHPDDD